MLNWILPVKVQLGWLGNGELTTHPFLVSAAISVYHGSTADVIKFIEICTLAC